MLNNIDNFFYPKSVAVIGASSKEKSIGYELTKTILSFGYKGKLYLTNPKGEIILGIKCCKSIEEINDVIDLAIIVVPKLFVEDSIDSLIAKNVKSIVLITAGFKETGQIGEEIEKRITEKIRSAGVRLVGPNCMGVISTLPDIQLNATFVAEKPEFGTTAFASQSGALGAAVLNSLRQTDIRFSHFISVGNKADINENDLINYWEKDQNINTIAMYLESFVNGEQFIKPFLQNRITKPVIILKAGKTNSGIKAASSHTGALSSSDKVVDALLKQFGIIRVNNINELFNTAKGFENFAIPQGNKVAVVTNAGGPAILAVDSLEFNGLELADLTEQTKIRLKEIVHPEGSINNPVDLLPGGNEQTFKLVTQIVANDINVDAVISIFVEPVMVQPLEVIEQINSIKSEKPIIQVVMPLPEFWENYKTNSVYKKPLFHNPEDPAVILSNMLFYQNVKNDNKTNLERIKLFDNKGKFKRSYNNGYLQSEQVNQLLKDYNIPVITEILIEKEKSQTFVVENFPIVIKGINKSSTHKSDIGGVILNIKNQSEFKEACLEIINNFAKHNLEVEQFLIQPFIKTKYELLIGGVRDNSFGPTLSFGLGGKYVELFADISIKSAYISKQDIDEMINTTKAGKMLLGLRGEKSVDLNQLKEIILNCAKMITENNNISEFDINPLTVSNDNKFYAVDSRIKIN
ncbi:MAG: acetate--CoA ligase family protein [bacterium]